MNKVPRLNLDNLRIARENVGITTQEASKGVFGKNSRNRVEEWENGADLPTWKQIEKLAKVYLLSPILLMQERSIEKEEALPDYRIGGGDTNQIQLKKFIVFLKNRQKWISEQIEDAWGKNRLVGSGRNIQTPKKLAERIKKELSIDLEYIKKIPVSRKKDALRYLISKIEEKGIFVAKSISFYDVPVESMRGMFLGDSYAPFIVINRRDSVSAQIFSLIHELAHLFRQTEGISNSLDFRDTSGVDAEETFCNQVAINFLLPENEVSETAYSLDEIKELSEIYKVSQLAVFYRLKDLKKVPRSDLNIFEKTLKKEMQENLLEKKMRDEARRLSKVQKGNYFNNMRDSNGSLFNRVVQGAYFDSQIGFSEASKLLKFSPEKAL